MIASRAKWREGRQLFLLATCGQAAQKLRDHLACNILAVCDKYLIYKEVRTM